MYSSIFYQIKSRLSGKFLYYWLYKKTLYVLETKSAVEIVGMEYPNVPIILASNHNASDGLKNHGPITDSVSDIGTLNMLNSCYLFSCTD